MRTFVLDDADGGERIVRDVAHRWSQMASATLTGMTRSVWMRCDTLGDASYRRLPGALIAMRFLCNGGLVPPWYHDVMAMNLRLSDAESEALRAKAEQEGRSMQEVAREAIAQYVSERPQRLRAAIERVRTEDRELLDRLAR